MTSIKYFITTIAVLVPFSICFGIDPERSDFDLIRPKINKVEDDIKKLSKEALDFHKQLNERLKGLEDAVEKIRLDYGQKPKEELKESKETPKTERVSPLPKEESKEPKQELKVTPKDKQEEVLDEEIYYDAEQKLYWRVKLLKSSTQEALSDENINRIVYQIMESSTNNRSISNRPFNQQNNIPLIRGVFKFKDCQN